MTNAINSFASLAKILERYWSHYEKESEAPKDVNEAVSNPSPFYSELNAVNHMLLRNIFYERGNSKDLTIDHYLSCTIKILH